MSEENKGVLIYMGNDGVFREYDQRNDIIIHCDSEEDRKHLMNKLERVLNSGWIPCSERLPEKEGAYITTLSGTLVGENALLVGWSYFESDCWEEFGNSHWEEDEFNVIAWMPLPEPYKENEDEGQADT